MNRTYSRFILAGVLAIGLTLVSTPALALAPHTQIQGLFNTTRDVVVKCLECHRDKATEVLQSTHWTWKRERTINGKLVQYGKKDSLAGFAVDIASNPSRCLRCHISGNPGLEVLDKGGAAEVDCLVCHDTTGTYARDQTGGKLQQRDYETIARTVGKPGPANCLTCHFADCGLQASRQEGPAVPADGLPADFDVHMTGRTGGFTCQSCHVQGSGHSFARAMAQGFDTQPQIEGCVSCHSGTPHLLDTLNRHTAAVSCRTCHIPEYATTAPALISWNWIMTGKINPVQQTIAGRTAVLQNGNGLTMTRMIRPVYLWDNGSDMVYTRGQRIQRQELTYLQRPTGKMENSKISPFRVLYGTQLFDAKYRYLISPLLSPAGPELFAGQDWDTIAREGMQAIVLPYSGQYGVTPTASYRRINHGVAQARDALGCTDCHGNGDRLNWQQLGYDRDPWPDSLEDSPQTELSGEHGITRKNEPLSPVKQFKILPTPTPIL